ncbi:3-deoxy-D-manno-octulosonate 8-phosphate phosphatase (KDO 8-P phosphatase) [Paenibacillus mucilaginosus]|uniref:KdsC family phosphatase n=1 Tax=Paenibacillus mucilaginosus TaxID=61624 RepID=UPI003D20E14C
MITPSNIQERLAAIRLLLMDVDGTLTDGSIILDSHGVESKQFNVRDGMGISLVHQANVATGLITARTSPIVQQRAKELNITYVMQGVQQKGDAARSVMMEAGVTSLQTAYIGDDVNDVDAFEAVGIKFAVGDAAGRLKMLADVILNKDGGRGAVREAVEQILAAKEALNRGK